MRAIFLDRDGTITNDSKFDKYKELKIFDNAADAIKILNKNFLVIVITNQPVVARGLMTEDQVKKSHEKINEHLKSKGAHIDAFYFCPHHPEQHADVPEHAKKYRIECDCRKPGIGLIQQAVKEHNVDLNKSFFVGDSTRDIQAAKNAGCISILVKTGYGGADGKYEAVPDYECENLFEASSLIDKIQNIGAVMLVGGRGERMRPLTDKIPKPMLPIKGKPILEHQIRLLKKYGVRDVIMCGHYMFDQIKNYFGDGTKFGVNIEYIDEQEPLGTGGAIKNAARHIKWNNFIVMNGDIATNLNIGKLIKFHSEKMAMSTQVLRISDHWFDSDAVEIDNNSKIIKFLGKGQAGVKTCNTGIAMLSRNFVNLIPAGVSNLENDTLKRVIPTGNAYRFVSDDYFKDVGTIERYEKAEKEFI